VLRPLRRSPGAKAVTTGGAESLDDTQSVLPKISMFTRRKARVGALADPLDGPGQPVDAVEVAPTTLAGRSLSRVTAGSSVRITQVGYPFHCRVASKIMMCRRVVCTIQGRTRS